MLIFAFPVSVSCAESVQVGNDSTIVHIDRQTDVLLDSSQRLSLADVLSDKYQTAFKPHQGASFNFGLTSSVIWLRFKIGGTELTSEIKRFVLAIDKPSFSVVDLYIPTPKGTYNKISGGHLNFSKGMTWEYRYPVFKLPHDLPENRYLFLRVVPTSPRHHAAASFSLFLADEDHFRRQIWFELSFYFLMFGVLGSMIFYNLFIFVMLKDRVYLLYVSYISFTLFYLFLRNGFCNLFGWQEFALYTMPFAASATIFGILFSQGFLALRLYTPVLNRLFWGIIFFNGLVIFLWLFGYPKAANLSMHLIAAIGSVSIFSAGIIRYHQGYQPARYYVAAWFTLLLGTLVFSLIGLGFLPKNFITFNALPIGSTLEAVLLSTALGNRIRILRQEKRELLKREQLLTDIIEFLPDPTWVIDKEGRVIAWNRAMEKITNIDKKEVLNKGEYIYSVPFYGEPRPMLIDLVLKRDADVEEECLNVEEKDGMFILRESFHPSMGDGGLFLSGTASQLNDSQGRVIGAIATIRDVSDAKRTEKERERMISELQEALSKVRTLSGLLPICASCKKIRDDKGYWNQIESYIHQHSEAEFSHSICPDCIKKLYGDEEWLQNLDNKENGILS